MTINIGSDLRPGTRTDVVSRFLAAIEAGCAERMSELYGHDARLDATVPGWRFSVRGREAIVSEYGRWFTEAASFVELRRLTTVDGEVVIYLLDWIEDGVQHRAHHVHVLTLDGDVIVTEQVFCGGRWPAPLLADMARARDAG